MYSNRWLYFIVGALVVAVALVALMNWDTPSATGPTASTPAPAGDVNVRVEQPARSAGPTTAPSSAPSGGASTAPATAPTR
jgi:hypothetical protein